MMKRFNWKLALVVFALCNLAFSSMACTAAWIGEVQSLMPEIQAAVSAVIALLVGFAGVPEGVATTAKTVETDVNNELTQAQDWTTEFTKTSDGKIPGKVKAALLATTDTLSGWIQGLGTAISAPLAAKITALVAAATAAIGAVVNIIPSAVAMAATHNPLKLKALDDKLTEHFKSVRSTFQTTWNHIADEPSGDAAVDAALAKLPRF